MKTGKKVKDFKNHVIFNYDGKDYDYAGIFNLIKELKYKKVGFDMDYLVVPIKDKKTGEDAICVFFQESNSNKDWFSNLWFFPRSAKAYKGWENRLRFHAGFYNEYQSGRDEIIKDIKQYVDKGIKRIFATGWSNGASTLPIACEDIFFQFGIRPTFIGYEGAQPCANRWTRDFVQDCFAEDSISFVYGMDIVPRVPPLYPKFRNIIYYLKVKEKFPILIRKIISIFTKEVYYHSKVDDGIEKYMPKE